MDAASIRLGELVCEAAFLIATSDDPAAARQKFNDDLTGELVAGARNMEGFAGLLVGALGERGGDVLTGDAALSRSPSSPGHSVRVPYPEEQEALREAHRRLVDRFSPPVEDVPGEDGVVAHAEPLHAVKDDRVVSVVWKFPLRLDDEQTVIVPQGAELLHVGEQHGQLMLWARVIPTGQLVRRTILVRGTGAPIWSQPYIGTVITEGGDLVWHIFDGGES